MSGRGNNDLSRYLSGLLRHRARDEGLKMSPDGYVKVDELLPHLARKRFRATLQDLQAVAEHDAKHGKQRFSLLPDPWRMRANQGHSVPVSDADLLTEITDPFALPVVIHGTNKKALAGIMATGLNSGTRQHIHFAQGEAGTVKSGMRASADVMIYVDVPLAMAEGIKFYLSENGVVLSRGQDGVLHRRFFKRVCARDPATRLFVDV